MNIFSSENSVNDYLIRYFNLNPEETDLQKALTERISFLLSENKILLKSILYRLDVDESKLAHVLTNFEGQELIQALIKLSIEKISQKLAIRATYSQKKELE
jgi:hypothetical protein